MEAECSELGQPTVATLNGLTLNVTSLSADDGAVVVHVSCGQGYTLGDQDTVVTCTDGKWDHPLPVCTPTNDMTTLLDGEPRVLTSSVTLSGQTLVILLAVVCSAAIFLLAGLVFTVYHYFRERSMHRSVCNSKSPCCENQAADPLSWHDTYQYGHHIGQCGAARGRSGSNWTFTNEHYPSNHPAMFSPYAHSDKKETQRKSIQNGGNNIKWNRKHMGWHESLNYSGFEIPRPQVQLTGVWK